MSRPGIVSHFAVGVFRGELPSEEIGAAISCSRLPEAWDLCRLRQWLPFSWPAEYGCVFLSGNPKMCVSLLVSFQIPTKADIPTRGCGAFAFLWHKRNTSLSMAINLNGEPPQTLCIGGHVNDLRQRDPRQNNPFRGWLNGKLTYPKRRPHVFGLSPRPGKMRKARRWWSAPSSARRRTPLGQHVWPSWGLRRASWWRAWWLVICLTWNQLHLWPLRASRVFSHQLEIKTRWCSYHLGQNVCFSHRLGQQTRRFFRPSCPKTRLTFAAQVWQSQPRALPAASAKLGTVQLSQKAKTAGAIESTEEYHKGVVDALKEVNGEDVARRNSAQVVRPFDSRNPTNPHMHHVVWRVWALRRGCEFWQSGVRHGQGSPQQQRGGRARATARRCAARRVSLRSLPLFWADSVRRSAPTRAYRIEMP